MPVPDFQTIMLPLLQLINDQKSISFAEASDNMSKKFQLTEQEKSEMIPSGNSSRINSNVSWARTYLKKAGLIMQQKRGANLEITARGKTVLSEKPEKITVSYLKKFPEFIEFVATPHQEEAADIYNSVSNPDEMLDQAFFTIKNKVTSDLLDKIKSCSPQFFERLVIDVLVAMGYGGSRKDAGQAIGQSGDEGIDGIINEDKLGLDVIYIQAKRWNGNVGRPEIQKFAGALQGKRAKKGVFITTSDFTAEAKDFVKNIESKIILVSGKELCDIIWDHNVGLSVYEVYEIKKIDSDYYMEE